MNVVTLLTEPPSGCTLVARATFVFTDVVGSTQLAERVGDERWAEVLRAHNRLVRRELAAAGGEEISFLGDGFLVLFTEPASAFTFARTLQQEIGRFVIDFPDAPLDLRIGLHSGDAYREGGDVFGRAVHVASRIADQAGPGEIAVSEDCRELVGSEAVRFWRAHETPLKGLPGSHRVWLTRSRAVLAPVA